jgi:hypothetical protein
MSRWRERQWRVASDERTAEAVGSSDSTKESLSQFVAKVLDQLSLSAWLPSAALVLSLAFVVNLRGSDGDLGDAVAAFGNYSVADGLFLFVAVVVLTMLTQAFEFEAIRFLEGYWGPARLPELLADIGCAHHTFRRGKILSRRTSVKRKAFAQAYFRLKRDLVRGPAAAVATERDLEILFADDADVSIEATEEEIASALAVPWTEYASPRIARRLEDLDVALCQYRVDNRVLPTRLGNVIRAYEDRAFPHTHGLPLASSVQRLFHSLPIHLQSEHDLGRLRY